MYKFNNVISLASSIFQALLSRLKQTVLHVSKTETMVYLKNRMLQLKHYCIQNSCNRKYAS